MELKSCILESFCVIGKEGSTKEGNDIIQKLWEDATSHFHEVDDLAKKDEQGRVLGIWGAMSDFSLSFQPWEEDFTQGLYLAGVEVMEGAAAPNGWVKWTIPSYEYIYVKNETTSTFSDVLEYLKQNNIELAGAVHDYNCPQTGDAYMFFPIRKIE